jgi:hypothetical protein
LASNLPDQDGDCIEEEVGIQYFNYDIAKVDGEEENVSIVQIAKSIWRTQSTSNICLHSGSLHTGNFFSLPFAMVSSLVGPLEPLVFH